MAQVLRSCAIAVVGSGTTVLEALALGTPLVAVVLAVNQAPVADALARLAVATVVDGRDPGGVAEAVTDLLADPERGRAMARRGRGFVDGRGALRAAAAMREPMLVVRPASLRDVDVLLEWRNDPVTRAASFQSEPVGRAEHSEWLERALASDDTVVSVGELAGRPMGTVRLDLRASGATISLTIAPWARDRGLARPLIRKALRQAATLGISRVYAHIRPQNHASQQAFASAGFEWTDDVEPAVPGALVMVANPSRKGGSVDED
jgi:RimJ/RimL family protein N-acetyltransferase